MRRSAVLALVVLTVSSLLSADPDAPVLLTHRVWLLDGVPDANALERLRAAGVDGLVVPVGRLVFSNQDVRFEMAPSGALPTLTGWPVSALLWLEGESSTVDIEEILTETAPIRRLLPVGGTFILAAATYWEGVGDLASDLAEGLGTDVELVLPATEFAAHLPTSGWARVLPVAVAFGLPEALGFPESLRHEELGALAELDAGHARYRVAVIVKGISVPPATQGSSLTELAKASSTLYEPSGNGDSFVLREPRVWGDAMLAAGDRVRLRVVQTTVYDRDLGQLLRPVRDGLLGWDTVGLPLDEPTLGMSRQAFVDYLRGGEPWPSPEIVTRWLSENAIEVSLVNHSPHASAVGATGNWVEIAFSEGTVQNIDMGEFAGAELGRIDGGTWRPAAVGLASALRLYVSYVPPSGSVGGAVVHFVGRPRALSLRWRMRLADGTSRQGLSAPPGL